MTKDLEKTLDVVIGRAAKLRAAGVLEISTEGLSFKLAAADPTDVPDSRDKKSEDMDESPDTNPWNDPATFGRSRGVPGKDPRKEPGQ